MNQKIRLERVENAMLELENGKSEATVKGLRNDLEQYGGSNDVTFIAGDRRKGLEHIAYRHGHSAIANVLDAVANGKLEKYVPAKKLRISEKMDTKQSCLWMSMEKRKPGY